MEFNFEVKSNKGRGSKVEYVVMASSSARLKDGSGQRQFSLYFSQEAKFLLDFLGDTVAIAFDYSSKKIALKPDKNGWRLSNRAGKQGIKEVKISRNDEWADVYRLQLGKDDIDIVNGMVILNFKGAIDEQHRTI